MPAAAGNAAGGNDAARDNYGGNFYNAGGNQYNYFGGLFDDDEWLCEKMMRDCEKLNYIYI